MAEEATIRIIGVLASILGVVAWAPQLKRVWIDKRHDGISLPTLWVVALALTLWLIYGVLIGANEIVVGNAIALTMILLVVFGVMKVRKPVQD
jgi:uncharacterized protein with PQ loop repeat